MGRAGAGRSSSSHHSSDSNDDASNSGASLIELLYYFGDLLNWIFADEYYSTHFKILSVIFSIIAFILTQNITVTFLTALGLTLFAKGCVQAVEEHYANKREREDLFWLIENRKQRTAQGEKVREWTDEWEDIRKYGRTAVIEQRTFEEKWNDFEKWKREEDRKDELRRR